MRIALANFARPACRGRRAGMLLASAALVFTAVFVFSSGAAAAVSVRTQQKKAAAPAAVVAKTAAPVQAKAVAAKPAESAAKGMNTGITVHGHWVINVLTPGGKLVSHTEFENSLQTRGMSILALVLGQQQTMGAWEISLAGAGPCTNLAAPPNGGSCIIDQSGTGRAAFDCAGVGSGGTCSTNMPTPVVSGGTLQLSGSLTFPTTQGGNITSVETVQESCANSFSPSTCLANASPSNSDGGGIFVFTIATLGTAGEPPVVPVGPGQIVQVTVTFSFS